MGSGLGLSVNTNAKVDFNVDANMEVDKDTDVRQLKLSVEGVLSEDKAFERIYPHLPATGPLSVKSRMTLVSECSIQGRRPGFEDAHVFGAVNASGTVISYAAVLDGHGGSNCSRSIARVFETLVAKIKLPNRRKVYPESVASVLRNHFKAFNEQLAKNGHFVTQGTTMCACFAIGETIYFVNLGDSIATWKMVNGESWYKLIDRWLDAAMFDKALKDGINQQDQWIRYRVAPRGEKVYKSTKVHSPQRDLLRIKEMGGFVTYGRLNGNLAVSRSLGDNWSDAVGKDPEVFWVPRRSFDIPYVLLMCDGMFEPYTFWYSTEYNHSSFYLLMSIDSN